MNGITIGDVLNDRYVIDRFIGQGGMQQVFACRDLALGRSAVLKVPKNGVKDRHFRRGAAAGALVNHPNVASTFDYYEDSVRTFMVEEFVGGTDLDKRLALDFKYLDPALAAHVVHHIARGLLAAHRAGICHRDLKPSNIMVSEDAGMSRIKLTDFGIAKMAQAELGAEIDGAVKNGTQITSSSTLLGAMPYLAPECWHDWSKAERPMDIWALGCIAYELLTGTPPFGSGAQAVGQVLKAAATNNVPLPRPSWYGTHQATAILENELLKLIASCLTIDPTARPKAEEVVDRIGEFCYPSGDRSVGYVTNVGDPYATSAWIDEEGVPESRFFHTTDFYGATHPKKGDRVSFIAYPGAPNPRASPVLQLK